MIQLRVGCLIVLLSLCASHGCTWYQTQHPRSATGPLPNPLEVAVTDHEFVWNQLVDTVDDYFEIAREERVRIFGNVMTEGRIETQWSTGPTIFDIFSKDATRGYGRWLGTFQSIRRKADLRVLPSQSGYGVNVIVLWELEDVVAPELSLVDASAFRHDGSLVRPQGRHVGAATTLGWIPLGRDVELEQKILADLYARLNHVAPPQEIQIMDPGH